MKRSEIDSINGEEKRSKPFMYTLRKFFAGKMIECLAKKGITMEISPNSLANLHKADEFLKNGSLFVFANHISEYDAKLGIPKGLLQLPHMVRTLYLMKDIYAVPNLEHKESFAIAALTQLASLLRIYVLPIPESNGEGFQKNNPIAKKRLKRYENKRDALMALNGTVIGFTPEGTRGNSLAMGQFKTGIVRSALLFLDSLCLPVGFVPKVDQSFEMVVGQPKSAREILGELVDQIQTVEKKLELATNTHEVNMLNLEKKGLLRLGADRFAQEILPLVPESMWGVYATTGGREI